jgi:peptide-methionine (S)-S-oxide reductase
MIRALDQQHIWANPIVTEVNAAEVFYPAEDYHQYYFDKNPNQPYCMAVAAPKAAKIRAKYAQLIKD